ncbi:MAG: helix-turn-helix domain-containing protein, partial [Phycisphaerae bacterium]
IDIAKALIENFGHVVPFQQLDENSPEREASEKIRTAIRRLRKIIKSAGIPIVIENRKAEGYLILTSTT